jgi:hypothetical protein
MLATMSAPCSVNTHGALRRPPRPFFDIAVSGCVTILWRSGIIRAGLKALREVMADAVHRWRPQAELAVA